LQRLCHYLIQKNVSSRIELSEEKLTLNILFSMKTALKDSK